jgi:preprotein translocase subunit SecG
MLLLPFMAVFEVICLVLCLLLSLVSREKAHALINWATRTLPNPDWYRR